MGTAEEIRAAPQAPNDTLLEWQTVWVREAVACMNRVTAAENEISKGIAQLVDASLEAAISSQKSAARIASEAMANNDPLAMMSLPQRFLQAAIRDGLDNSVRTLQSAQTLFSQVQTMTAKVDDGESRKP